MSKLSLAIKECMRDLRSSGEDGIRASFNFPSTFIGFKGHFPGKPILPGVCKIQAILGMIQEAAQKTPQLKEIISAKFFTPVTYDEEITCAVRQEPESNEETRVSALVTNKDKKIAEIKLRIIFK